MTLKRVLEIAGGFDDPVFRKSINENITILRKDKNNFYSIEMRVSYNDAQAFKLEVGDKILVYQDINYRNSFTYTISGQVNQPGTYPLNTKKI